MACTTDGPDFQSVDDKSEDAMSVEYESADGCILELCNPQNLVIEGERLQDRLGIHRMEPYVGMTFSSLDEARDFYFVYAKKTGFSVRASRLRHSVAKEVIGREFVCSREGFRAENHIMRTDRVLPARPATREGCKAMIRFAISDGGNWVVTKFVGEHNHIVLNEDEKDQKIRGLREELQHERERSSSIQQQLRIILEALKEHEEFMAFRVANVVNRLKQIELGDL